MAEEHEALISKHSSGVSIIIRINGLWIDANLHSCAGQYSKWNTKLDVIWRELARDILEDDWEGKREAFDEFDAQLVEEGPFIDTGSDTFEDITTDQSTTRSKHYRILTKKELFLKRLENKLGKGTTFHDGEEDDF